MFTQAQHQNTEQKLQHKKSKPKKAVRELDEALLSVYAGCSRVKESSLLHSAFVKLQNYKLIINQPHYHHHAVFQEFKKISLLYVVILYVTRKITSTVSKEVKSRLQTSCHFIRSVSRIFIYEANFSKFKLKRNWSSLTVQTNCTTQRRS